MSSRKARSLVWVLVALVACSVLARLARDGRSTESVTVQPSGRASVMVEATEFFYRLDLPESEAMTEEESREPHPASCVCHRILEQQLASDCRFGAPVLVAERRNGKVVGWRVSWDDSEHLSAKSEEYPQRSVRGNARLRGSIRSLDNAYPN